jgi:hypothetical protein
MGCYLVPLTAAGLHYIYRRKNGLNSKYDTRLTQLLVGASTFGVIDHLWNGELFLFGSFLTDMALGVTITVAVFGLAFFLDRSELSVKA